MKSIGFTRSLPIDTPESLFEFDSPMPQPGRRDLLVEIKAIAVNPADAKRRMRLAVDAPMPEPKVLGYDAVGVVVETGPDVTLFSEGDEVWYAGDATRPGCNTQFQLVDERIVGRKPAALTNAEAAAMPLTGLTAWELLFDRFGLKEGQGAGKTLLVIGAAGGVGSMTLQLARQLTSLTIIATASRDETTAWCKDMGAHEVVNHHDLVAEVKARGYETVDYIVQYANTAQHWDAMCELVAPQGKIGTIVETKELIDISRLQQKSASLHWELMFTRAMFETDDMIEQHNILTRMAELTEAGTLRTTLQQTLKGFSVDTLKEAHRRIETTQTIGKLVIDY